MRTMPSPRNAANLLEDQASSTDFQPVAPGRVSSEDSAQVLRTSGPGNGDSDSVQVIAANAGDHALIHRLLLEVCQSPSREEFHASQDDPFYEPSDRLLVKLEDRIVAHVQLARRVMQFGQVHLPISEVQWLVALPEYRSAGYTSLLLEEADHQMAEDGAVLAMMRTGSPERFESLGWVSTGRPAQVQASARNILSQLADQPASRASHQPLSTRVWRHVELSSLIELYERSIASAFGPLRRSEHYWQWLISRRGYDKILVAIEGEDSLEFGQQAPSIVGYAITRQERMVELVASDDRPAIAASLLARAARDAIERDDHLLLVNVPPNAKLQALLAEVGAMPSESLRSGEEVSMVKLLDPQGFLTRLYPELLARCKAAELARPLELLFQVDETSYRLVLSRRSVRLLSGDSSSKPDVSCSRVEFTRLLLSQLDLETAIESGDLKVRNKTIRKMLSILFPRHPLWRPPLDHLQA